MDASVLATITALATALKAVIDLVDKALERRNNSGRPAPTTKSPSTSDPS